MVPCSTDAEELRLWKRSLFFIGVGAVLGARLRRLRFRRLAYRRIIPSRGQQEQAIPAADE